MTAFDLLFDKRPDWQRTENAYVYLLSFGGPLPPRLDENDLGVEPLTVHLGPAHELFLCPCRAVNGCSRHDAPGAVHRPASAAELEPRLAELEAHARTQRLTGEFGHCLLEGPCSERAFGPFWLVTHPQANIPPWELAGRTTSQGASP